MAGIDKSLQMIFLISNFFLIFPLRLGETGFHYSTFLAAFSFGHIVLLTYGIYCNFHIHDDSVNFTPITTSVYNIMVTSMCFNTFVAIASSYLSINRFNELLSDLKEIDNHFSDYLTSFDVCGFLKCTFTSIFMSIFITAIDVLSIQDDLFTTFILYWSLFITQIQMYQFRGLMEIFSIRFKILNKCLKTMTKLKLPQIRKVVYLVKIHKRLSECSIKSNQIYSFQLLLYFFTYFIAFATESCFFVVIAKTKIDLKIVCCSVDLLLLFSFYSVLSRTHNVMKEAKEFNIRLYQLMIYDGTGLMINNKNLQLQIVTKGDIILTACGFFKLDLNLFINMIGAVATYCVILIRMS